MMMMIGVMIVMVMKAMVAYIKRDLVSINLMALTHECSTYLRFTVLRLQ